jgi:hypothetical protein
MKKTNVRTRYSFFSLNGLAARILIAASRISPEPVDIAVAVAFGIVEMLGVKRLMKILGPAVKAQIQAMGRKNATGS